MDLKTLREITAEAVINYHLSGQEESAALALRLEFLRYLGTRLEADARATMFRLPQFGAAFGLN